MTTEFKIQGVGIDLTTSILPPTPLESSDENYDFIHTSINANNDFIIADYVDSSPQSSIITSTSLTENLEFLIDNHLHTLKREHEGIGLLLLELTENDMTDEEVNLIQLLIESGKIQEVGIKNPKNVQQLQNVQTSLEKVSVKFIGVGINICPLSFNYEIINWCDTNDVKVFGFNPFGGNISSAAIIESFTVPYLLGFSSAYSFSVILSGRDLILSEANKNFLIELIGKSRDKKFELSKSVSKLYKPLKKAVNPSVIIFDKVALNYDLSGELYDYALLLLTLGKPINRIIDGEELPTTKTTIESGVFERIEASKDFLNKINDSDLKYAAIRYIVLDYLRTSFSKSKGWSFDFIKAGKHILGIKVFREVRNRKLFNLTTYTESFNFILSSDPLSNSKDSILFMDLVELENSSTKA